MPTLNEVFTEIMRWKQPPGGENPFKLGCRVETGASPAELEAVGRLASDSAELTGIWSLSRESWLFEDIEYGQWGLHLLSPADSDAQTASMRAERPDDVRPDDVVIGEFLGDLEKLVYAPSEEGERRILVALPLDSRDEWPAAGTSAAEFLKRLLRAGGDKFWESSSR